MGAAETRQAETIGRYEVVGRLAMGGMAEILLGRLLGPSGFERPVVIKRILPHLAEQSAFVDMFLDEARLAARIQHRNVVQVQELGREGQNLFLAMEYLQGENTAGLIRRSLIAHRTLDFALIAYIVAEACAGLHAAHELKDPSGNSLNLVHRDVSPQNIFVTYDGQVKVLDFGIAKAADRTAHTEVGQLKGKFEYMSPEQCRGKAIDRRSDIFAMGIVLYELIVRKRLFKRGSKLAVLEAVCREPIVPPSQVVQGCPLALDAVVLKALAREAAERYQTAAELRRDLLSVMRNMGGPVEPAEALAEQMHALFQDRLAEKRDMLHRVSAGIAIAAVPSAEADERFEIPEIDVPEGPGAGSIRQKLESGFTFGGSHSGSGMDALELERAAARRSLMLKVAVVLAVVVVAGCILIWWSMPRPDGVALRTAVTALMPPQAMLPKPAPPPPAPEARQVMIDVVSEPAGASVDIGGENKGTTPVTVELPRGTDPVEIKLKHDGYQEAVEKVTPDVHQRVRVSLTKNKPKGFGGLKPGGGFHRFD